MPRDDYLAALSDEMKNRHLTFARNIKNSEAITGLEPARSGEALRGIYRCLSCGGRGEYGHRDWRLLGDY